MLYAIQIDNTIFTCCTTGQQAQLAQAAYTIGAKYFARDCPHKSHHAEYENYDTPETLQAFIRATLESNQ